MTTVGESDYCCTYYFPVFAPFYRRQTVHFRSPYPTHRRKRKERAYGEGLRDLNEELARLDWFPFPRLRASGKVET